MTKVASLRLHFLLYYSLSLLKLVLSLNYSLALVWFTLLCFALVYLQIGTLARRIANLVRRREFGKLGGLLLVRCFVVRVGKGIEIEIEKRIEKLAVPRASSAWCSLEMVVVPEVEIERKRSEAYL